MAISLKKNEPISLKKVGSKLSKISLGLGWEPVGKKKQEEKKPKGFWNSLFSSSEPEIRSYESLRSIDLDASCIVYDKNNRQLDKIWFQKLTSMDRSIYHSGDNRTGAGDGDDETITVNLDQLHHTVRTLIFTINSFSGQTFESIENITCNLYDHSNGESTTLATYSEKMTGKYTATVIAKIQRGDDGEWNITALGKMGYGKTLHDIDSQIVSSI